MLSGPSRHSPSFTPKLHVAVAAALALLNTRCTLISTLSASGVAQVHSTTSASSPGSSGLEVRADAVPAHENKVGSAGMSGNVFLKGTGYKASDDSALATVEAGFSEGVTIPIMDDLNANGSLSASIGGVLFPNLFDRRPLQSAFQATLVPGAGISLSLPHDFQLKWGVSMPFMYWGPNAVTLGSDSTLISPNQSAIAPWVSVSWNNLVEVGCTSNLYPWEGGKDYSTCSSAITLSNIPSLLKGDK